jgi:carboxymethylenebutenolidase
VTRRFAKSGYAALAVDLVSREGGTAANDPTAIPGMLTAAGPDRHVGDFQAGLAYLKTQGFVKGDRVGMTGYCFGGGVVWLTASRTPELKAIAPYYGPSPADPKVLANIKAAVLGVFASDDNFVNPKLPDMEAALKEGKVAYEFKQYPNSRHAFHNDTGNSYAPDAAKAAWADTLALFDKVLKS